MYIIPIKNRLVAIGITIVASLFATAGLFFAINNLSNTLTSFDKISTKDTVLQIELFSPLLASIKTNKPVNDFEVINSNLQMGLDLLANKNTNNAQIKDLVGSQGHVMLSFTASGDMYLVTSGDNNFSDNLLVQPLFSNSKMLNDFKLFSNNQEVLNKIAEFNNDDNSIMISFNDLARVTVQNSLFTSEKLSETLGQLKQMLQPLEKDGSNFSATIQQSNHRTKIQFFNLKQQDTNSENSLSPLIDLFPQNITAGYLSNNSSSTVNNLANIINKELLDKYLTPEQPILYANNSNNNWLIATTSNSPEQVEQLTTLFARLYDLKVVETSLPDGSYVKEIKIKDVKTIDWKTSSSQNIIWKLKTNTDHDLVIARKDNIYVAGKKDTVNEVIINGGYFPDDCKLNELTTAVSQKIGTKYFYFSENINKNAVFCVFN